MRVALLTNILTPYRLPVYRDLAGTPGWQLRVLLCAADDPSWQRVFEGAYQEGRAALDVEIVAGASLRRRVRTHPTQVSEQMATLHVPWGVTSELGPRTAFAAAYAALHRVPLVIWSYHARSAAAAVGPVRRALRRALLARADAVVGMGRQAREVLRGLGVSETMLFDAPNAHAAESWEARLAALDVDAERLALRASLGAREQIALVAGRLEASKGVLPLLDAWRALPEAAHADWTLLFVGDGPLAPAVEDARRACGAGAIARMPALRPDALAAVYAASDLLVFPSLADPWGLVVNEAMACGLPVLCSRLAGCADDLIAPGQTGWLCDPTDPTRFRDALAHALTDPARALLGARARDAAKRFGPATLAGGLRRAILHAAARR
jgi:glycosyltransferase involved in cell wall biosynthesis